MELENSLWNEAVEKAAAQFGESKLQKASTIATSTGLYGYDLEQPAKLLMATLQGYFYRIARVPGRSLQRRIKVITGVKLPGSKFAASGSRGNSAQISLTEYYWQPGVVTGGTFIVDREALAISKSYDDAVNRATMLNMKLGLRNQAAAIFGGNVTALGAVTGFTAVENTSVTSAAVALNSGLTYYFYVRAMTAAAAQDALTTFPNGQALPDPSDRSFSAIIGCGVSLLDGYGAPSTIAGWCTIATPATTSSATLAWTPIPAAAAYGIFIGTTTGIENAVFAGMVGQCSVVVKDFGAAFIAGSGTKASATQAYYDGNGDAQSKNTMLDTSADANAFNGILPQIAGTGGATPQTGIMLGGQILNINGPLSAAQGAQIPEIKELLMRCYYALYQSDDVTLLFSAADRDNINNSFGSSGTGSILRINMPAGVDQMNARAGIFVNGYIHPATGRAIPCETDPNIPQGMFLVLPNSMPYPDTNIENPIMMVVMDEWINLQYAMTRPRYEFENRCYEACVVNVPIACGLGYNMFRG
jgi:hypothetical protein